MDQPNQPNLERIFADILYANDEKERTLSIEKLKTVEITPSDIPKYVDCILEGRKFGLCEIIFEKNDKYKSLEDLVKVCGDKITLIVENQDDQDFVGMVVGFLTSEEKETTLYDYLVAEQPTIETIRKLLGVGCKVTNNAISWAYNIHLDKDDNGEWFDVLLDVWSVDSNNNLQKITDWLTYDDTDPKLVIKSFERGVTRVYGGDSSCDATIKMLVDKNKNLKDENDLLKAKVVELQEKQLKDLELFKSTQEFSKFAESNCSGQFNSN